MIVTCPACATRYLIDPRALGGTGRSVRCTQCTHVWTQLPPEDAPRRVDRPQPGAAVPPLAKPASRSRAVPPGQATTMPDGQFHAAAPEGNVARGGNRPLLIVLIAVLVLFALWYGRDFIVERVPALQSVYAAFGVAAAGSPWEPGARAPGDRA